jgi:hypothetical protein
MLLFYIVQRIAVTKVILFSMICYPASFQDPVLSGVSIASTSQVLESAVLVLLIYKIKIYVFGVVSNGIKIPTLISIHLAVLELKHADKYTNGQTDTISPLCVHLVQIMERTHK